MDPSITQILDAELKVVLPKIHSHPTLTELSKHLKIRISSWLSKLESIMSNNMWRKNRNNYLKLLYIMLEWKEIIEPFTNMPPDEIPTLQKNFINSILLKLTTKAKEKFRDKERSEGKLQKLTPEEIWVSFDSKLTLKKTESSATFKTFTNEESHWHHISKANKLSLIAPESLTPISQNNLYENSRALCNSTLSSYTCNSIEKCKDLLNDIVIEHETQEKENKCPTKKVNLSQVKIKKEIVKEQIKKGRENFGDSAISYFRKNRQSNNLSEEFAKPSSCQNGFKSKEFYGKVFTFLKRHQLELQSDNEYSNVIEGMQHFLFPNTETKPHDEKINENYFVKASQPSESIFTQPSYQFNKISYEDEIPEIEESYTFDDNNERSDSEYSYNYGYGKFSEFSEIEVDEGVSPSRALDLI